MCPLLLRRYAWLDRVAPLTHFINPLSLVRWNLDKHYLRDLQARGVHTTPTHFLEIGSRVSLPDWLAQRLTAVTMALYTLLWLMIAGYHGGVDHDLWQALFANAAFRVATLLFGLALLWHAWIGMRDIWMDYIKPTALRLTLEMLTVVVLLCYAGWLIDILWGAR